MSRNEAQARIELVDLYLIDQRGWPRANYAFVAPLHRTKETFFAV